MRDERKPLRALSPDLYLWMTQELEKQFHIQPYDVQIDGVEKDEGMEVIIRYGEQFSQHSKQFFSSAAINEKSIQKFIESTGEICQETLIKNYYRMMAP